MSIAADHLYQGAAVTGVSRDQIACQADALRAQATAFAATAESGSLDIALMALAQAAVALIHAQAPAHEHAAWVKRAQYLVGNAHLAAQPHDDI